MYGKAKTYQLSYIDQLYVFISDEISNKSNKDRDCSNDYCSAPPLEIITMNIMLHYINSIFN
ncbi:hypothetical protein AC76_4690 [Escherichia coli 5-172-05_S4_C1]|nr:hypothetical protein AD04_4569 [Escherichia coli 5-172-05_S4_C2]KEL36280.1 hypothetical protein AC76_4690 [Escherichia coli 5-172-05_S4_C1]